MEARTLGIGISAVAIALFGGFVMYSIEVDSLESKLNKQKIALKGAQSELESSVQRGERARKRVAEARAAKEAVDSAEAELEQKKTQLEEESASAARELEELQAGIAEMTAKMKAAVEKVREQSVGEAHPELTLATGKVLKQAKLRKVNPESLSFSHSLGSVTVAWRDLPAELAEKFQLRDPEPVAADDTENSVPEASAAPVTAETPAAGNGGLKAAAEKTEKIQQQITQGHHARDQWLAKEAEYRELHRRAQLLGRSSAHLIKAEEAKKNAAQISSQIDRLERQLLQIQKEALK